MCIIFIILMKINAEKVNKKPSGNRKKNWRKIDTADLEKKDIEHKNQVLLEKNISNIPDKDLFQIETAPTIKGKYTSTKKKAGKVVKKLTKYEERKIKRVQRAKAHKQVEQPKEQPQTYDLWGSDTNNQTSSIKFPSAKTSTINYPKIPIAHPGQSYNPAKKDLDVLLHKVVELNKKPEILQEINKREEVEQAVFESGDEEEDRDPEFKISTNPPVDDYNQRKTKTERNRAIKRKLNRIKDEQLLKKKRTKVALSESIGMKRFIKEKEINSKQAKSTQTAEQASKKEKERLLKLGIVEE